MSIFDAFYNWVMAWPWTTIKDTIDWFSKLIGTLVAIIAFVVAWKSYNSWYTQKRYDIDIQNVKEILTLFYEIRFYIHNLRFDSDLRKQVRENTNDHVELEKRRTSIIKIVKKLNELLDRFHVLCEVNSCIHAVDVREEFKRAYKLGLLFCTTLQYKITNLSHNNIPDVDYQNELTELSNKIAKSKIEIDDILHSDPMAKSTYTREWENLTDDLKKKLNINSGITL